MKDLYSILGVARGADDATVKKAYRKLAKELHPDRHPGNAKISDRFKEVSAAYGILGDKDKRARYDRGEIDESGAERAPFGAGGPGGFGGFRTARAGGVDEVTDAEDLFADLFGFGRGRARRPRAARGRDVTYRLRIGFVEALHGVTRRLTLSNGKTLDVRIPAAVRDGQQIRLTGQGEPGAAGGPAGDALVQVEVAPHPWFRREGDDLHLDLPVSINEAVLGAKVTVPTPEGPVALAIPKSSSSGKRLRLKGKGVPKPGGAGDLYVTLRIVLPEAPDAALEKAIAAWAKGQPGDVRGGLAL